MLRKLARRLSVSAHGFSYRAFLVFFLASVVPLGFLAYVADRHVIPSMVSSESEASALGIMAAIVMIAVLALLSFVLLGRTMREAMASLLTYNARLKTLLGVSSTLSDATYSDVIARRTAEAAAKLTSAAAACVYFYPTGPGTAALDHVASGPLGDALLREKGTEVARLADAAVSRRAPVFAGANGIAGPGEAEPVSLLGVALAVPIVANGQVLGALVLTRELQGPPFDANDQEVATALSHQAGTALQNAFLHAAQKNFFTHVTEILVQSLDRYLDFQPGHSKRVAHLANLIGREMALGEERVSRLYFAALLHDVGMLKVASVEADDRAHPALGFNMISPITVWHDLAPFIQHHHEWYDGRGYPKGLRGDEIPLESRILALAEAFDTMTRAQDDCDRMTPEAALQEIKRHSGTRFDPPVVSAFLNVVNREGADF